MLNPQLAPLAVPLDSLKPSPANARLHDERNLQAIAHSLRRFGQQKPVVTLADGTLLAGHGVVEAAKLLGWTELAAVVFSSTKEADAAGFAIADNRTAELSTWNHDVLREHVASLVREARELVAGFTDTEIDALMTGWEPGTHDVDADKEYDASDEHFVVKVADVPLAEADRVAEVVRGAVRALGYDYKLAIG